MAFTINGTGVSEWKTLLPWHKPCPLFCLPPRKTVSIKFHNAIQMVSAVSQNIEFISFPKKTITYITLAGGVIRCILGFGILTL